jgi:hypothetical protein
MRRTPAPTEPLTTLPTTITDMIRPSTPNATTNGTIGRVLPSASSFALR